MSLQMGLLEHVLITGHIATQKDLGLLEWEQIRDQEILANIPQLVVGQSCAHSASQPFKKV